MMKIVPTFGERAMGFWEIFNTLSLAIGVDVDTLSALHWLACPACLDEKHAIVLHVQHALHSSMFGGNTLRCYINSVLGIITRVYFSL